MTTIKIGGTYMQVIVRRLDNPAVKEATKLYFNLPINNVRENSWAARMHYVLTIMLNGEHFHFISDADNDWMQKKPSTVVRDVIYRRNYYAVCYKSQFCVVWSREARLITEALRKGVPLGVYVLVCPEKNEQP
jgi:hypothetical protein